MFVTLKEAKKHLNIDDGFTDDDTYITTLIQVADIALNELIVGGKLPSAVTHSILLMIGNLYANREPVSYSTVMKVPYTMEYLLGLYKHYNIP